MGHQLSPTDNPITLFKTWLDEATKSEPLANAMTLATADKKGKPSARLVLLKEVNQQGFVFYTNLGSPKANDLSANPIAELCFYWKSLRKQVRIHGGVVPVADEQADHYFATRPRESRIGAWASKQSQPMKTAHELDERVEQFTRDFEDQTVSRPEFWSGYCVIPETIELWLEQPSRLHERMRYTRCNDTWEGVYLFP